jgi:hypothetical protein
VQDPAGAGLEEERWTGGRAGGNQGRKRGLPFREHDLAQIV